MKNIYKFVIALLPTVLTTYILRELFPYTGLARVFDLPFIFALNSSIIFLGIIVTPKFNRFFTILTWIGITFLTVVIAVESWSQEFLPPVADQIRYSISAIQNYDNTAINDLKLPLSKGYDYDNETNYIEGAPERYVVALYKYRHQIPLDGSYYVYFDSDVEPNTPVRSIDEIPSKLEGHHKVIWWLLNILRK